jgi:hypothetical protein
MKVLETAPDAVLLPVGDVVDLHNYVMGDVRAQQIQRRRRIFGQAGLYKFCMLDRSNDLPSDDTGTVDTYFSMRLNKLRPRYWSMLIGFREGINTQATATTNFLTVYRMDWTKAVAMGITWRRMNIAAQNQSQLVPLVRGQIINPAELQNASLQHGGEVSYMDSTDISAIRARIADVTEAIARTTQSDGPDGKVTYSSLANEALGLK